MKYLTLIFFVILGLGCEKKSSESGNEISLTDINLTGTWIAVNETKTYKTDTGEFLSSDFVKLKYVLEDTDVGVKYDRCWEYGGISLYGIKTDKHFYMNTSENGYSLTEDGSLQQTSEFVREYQPGFNFESIVTLRKVSEEVSIDNGTLVLDGPISHAEYDQVCLWQVDYSIGDGRTVELIVPFDTDSLSLRFELRGDIAPGTYQYTDQGYNSPVRIDVISNSDIFWNQINTNTLGATNVSVTVTESTAKKFSGTYTFLGQDQGDYSGEFEIIY